MPHHDIIGLIGVALVLWAYVALQLRHMDQSRPAFSVLNGLGSVGILYSLAFDFNLASAIANTVWVLVSAYALARAWRARPSTPSAD